VATIANLKVLLTTKTAAFNRNVGRAAKRIGSIGRAAAGAVGRVKMLSRSLLAGALGGVGVAFLGKRALGTLDTLTKTADKLGATTEGLATLHLAARRAGLESRALDMALQRLVRRAGTVAAGTEAMGKTADKTARFFNSLGLDAKKLAAMPADIAFREWLTALEKVGPQGEQVARAFKFVDSEGVGVVNMIKEVVHGWDALTAKARDFGRLFTRTQLESVVRAVDAIGDLTDKLMGVTLQLTAKLSPIIEVVANKFIAMLGPAPELADKIIGAIAWVAEKVLWVWDKIRPVLDFAGRTIAMLIELGLKGVRLLADSLGIAIPAALDKAIKKMEEFNALLEARALAASALRGTEILLGIKQRSSFEKVADWFRGIMDSAAAASEAAVGAATGRILENTEAAAQVFRATAQQARASAFGAGARAPALGWWGGQIQITTEQKQLKALETISGTLKRIEKQEQGLGQ
jgi:hypothetical protein